MKSVGLERVAKVGGGGPWPPRCPACGSVLASRLVEIKEEDGTRGEPLLLLDCPRNDFHAAVPYQEVVTAVTTSVAEKLAASR